MQRLRTLCGMQTPGAHCPSQMRHPLRPLAVKRYKPFLCSGPCRHVADLALDPGHELRPLVIPLVGFLGALGELPKPPTRHTPRFHVCKELLHVRVKVLEQVVDAQKVSRRRPRHPNLAHNFEGGGQRPTAVRENGCWGNPKGSREALERPQNVFVTLVSQEGHGEHDSCTSGAHRGEAAQLHAVAIGSMRGVEEDYIRVACDRPLFQALLHLNENTLQPVVFIHARKVANPVHFLAILQRFNEHRGVKVPLVCLERVCESVVNQLVLERDDTPRIVPPELSFQVAEYVGGAHGQRHPATVFLKV